MDYCQSDNQSYYKLSVSWVKISNKGYRNFKLLYIRFHPSQSKILGCAADTDGWIGFWDVNGREENGDPVTYKYRPHRRTVTDMHFNPVDNSKLLSSSYDGFIRVFDMNTAKFDTLELGSNKYSISGFDMTQDGHCVGFSILPFQQININ